MKVADITPERLTSLNSGTVETTTLTECLAVDFPALAQACIPEIGQKAISHMKDAASKGISRRMALMGELLLEHLPEKRLSELEKHASDTVRGWACFIVGARQDYSLEERLQAIRPFADDHHFGVREWAWLAVRPHLTKELESAISILATWTTDDSERLRRFASEATRPRGVWCAHIKQLKQEPHLGLPILEPLWNDPASYVQKSVGTWLNDAAKDNPEWVMDLCNNWLRESADPATQYICKRAQRSLKS